MTFDLTEPHLEKDHKWVDLLNTNNFLPSEELRQINLYWRAANYLSVGQICL